MLCGIKSALILKKNLIANVFPIKTKILSYGNKAADFHDKEIPKAGSDYTCLAVINIDSVLKKGL